MGGAIGRTMPANLETGDVLVASCPTMLSFGTVHPALLRGLILSLRGGMTTSNTVDCCPWNQVAFVYRVPADRERRINLKASRKRSRKLAKSSAFTVYVMYANGSGVYVTEIEKYLKEVTAHRGKAVIRKLYTKTKTLDPKCLAAVDHLYTLLSPVGLTWDVITRGNDTTIHHIFDKILQTVLPHCKRMPADVNVQLRKYFQEFVSRR